MSGPQPHWTAEGAAQPDAPRWAKFRAEVAGEFPSPYRGAPDPLAQRLARFVEKLDQLRPGPDGPALLGPSGALDDR